MKRIVTTLLFIVFLSNAVFSNNLKSRILFNISKSMSYDAQEVNPAVKLYFNSKNENLIIGCSPVTYAYLKGFDYVKKYGYDLIGWGSTLDDLILEELNQIKNKKYDKIVLWFGYNDIGTKVAQACVDKSNDFILDTNYYQQLETIIETAKRKLNKDGEIVLLQLKHITFEDWQMNLYCDNFNKNVDLINNYINFRILTDNKLKTVSTEKYESATKDGGWYVHFEDKQVYEDLFKRINSI